MVILRSVPSLTEFHDYLATVRSANTARAYHGAAQSFVSFLRDRKLTFGTVHRSILQDFVVALKKRGLQPKSIRLTITGANRFINWLKDRGVVIVELAKPDIPRSKSKKPEIIDQAVLEDWLKTCINRPEPFRSVLMLLPFIGLRSEEVCRLRIANLSRNDDRIAATFVGKGDKERRVPLSDEAVKILDGYVKRHREGIDSVWLFPRPDDPKRAINSGALRYHVQEARKECGHLWISAHKLRHVFATLLSRQGVQIEVIKDLLGHANIQTTTIYIHPNDDSMVDAVGRIQRGA